MSNYSRWKDTIEKHDREDGICPLLDDVYEQGRVDAIDELLGRLIEMLIKGDVDVEDLRKLAEQLKSHNYEEN